MIVMGVGNGHSVKLSSPLPDFFVVFAVTAVGRVVVRLVSSRLSS